MHVYKISEENRPPKHSLSSLANSATMRKYCAFCEKLHYVCED